MIQILGFKRMWGKFYSYDPKTTLTVTVLEAAKRIQEWFVLSQPDL
jgi:hypothetical protein